MQNKNKSITVFIILAVLITSPFTFLSAYAERVDRNAGLKGEITPIVSPPLVDYILLTYEKPKTKVVQGNISAYSSSIDETDNEPFTAANGRRVFDGLIANNCHAFGTTVDIGQRTFIVGDRLNSRYGCEYWDVWMSSKEEAIKFGKQWKLITIYQ